MPPQSTPRRTSSSLLPIHHALPAGKDVYVEKPLSLTIAEGRKMVQVATERAHHTSGATPAVVQEFARSRRAACMPGRSAKVTVVRCFHLRNESPMGIGNPGDCGAARRLRLGHVARAGAQNPITESMLLQVSLVQHYSGGNSPTSARIPRCHSVALQKDAPRGVFAVGGKYAVTDNREIPDNDGSR